MTDRKARIKVAAVNVLIWAGFCFVFVGHPLLKSGVVAVPFLTKAIAVCASVFYLNLYFLMPRFLFKGKYLRYSFSVLLTMIVENVILKLFEPWREMEIDGDEPPIRFLWSLMMIGMFFVSSIYGMFYRDRHLRKREMDLEHQNIEFEMKFLKSQINPHFLFNALNNIYALSVIKSARTPDMILKLSDMLRFTLYGSENKKVKIGREIEYIVNFIEFQKLKMDNEPNIRIDYANCNTELMIEPMLMIPFIENSFKHGNIDNVKKGWLQVEIKTLGPILIFKVRNSLPVIAINKDVVGGIGVENVRKRLEILYPGRSELKIETTDNEFSVYMKIDTFVSE